MINVQLTLSLINNTVHALETVSESVKGDLTYMHVAIDLMHVAIDLMHDLTREVSSSVSSQV